MIEKYTEEPEWVEEMIDGELVIHNIKLEEYIPVEQPTKLYGIAWNTQGEKDILTAE